MAVELALMRTARSSGCIEKSASVGAYLNNFGPLPAFGNLGGIAGVYTTPAISATITGVFTNAAPTSPYPLRAPKRRLRSSKSSTLAREMRIDRIELRRQNIIPPDAFPYQTALTYNYDSGEFERNMDRALEMADAAGLKPACAIAIRRQTAWPWDGQCNRASGRHVRRRRRNPFRPGRSHYRLHGHSCARPRP